MSGDVFKMYFPIEDETRESADLIGAAKRRAIVDAASRGLSPMVLKVKVFINHAHRRVEVAVPCRISAPDLWGKPLHEKLPVEGRVVL
jgi:hypothetical protein